MLWGPLMAALIHAGPLLHYRSDRFLLRPIKVLATAYCLTGTTAIGWPVGKGIVATDPIDIPLGSVLVVPGYGAAIAADTGAWIKGHHIDLWMASCTGADRWGARTVMASVMGRPR